MKPRPGPLSNADFASMWSIGILCAIVLSLLVVKILRLNGTELAGAGSYAMIADSLLINGTYTTIGGGSPAIYRAPLYVLLVAASKLFSTAHWSEVLLLLQAAAAALTGFLINRTTRRLTESGWLAAGVTLTYAGHLAWLTESLALRESGLFGLLVAWFFYMASSTKVTGRTLAVMTLICLLAYHTRATGFLLIVALLLFVILQAQTTLKRRTVLAALIVSALAVGVAPWQAYQSRALGRLTLAPTSVGSEQLYIGNSKMFDHVSPYVDVEAGSFVYDIVTRHSAAADDPLGALALAEIHADPLRFFRKVCLKATVYLSPLATPLGSGDLQVSDGALRITNYQGNLVSASRDWLPFATHLMSFFVVLFIVPLGLLGNLREALSSPANRAIAITSLFFIAANIGLYALLTAETRYRMYLDPLLMIWAWIALARVFRTEAPAVAISGA